ncbi:MAG: ABC transporter substrate-binding protein [Kiritimatiellia bacterium]
MRRIAALVLLIFSVTAFPGTAPARRLEQVNLQLKFRHGFQFAGYYAAKIKGFYEKEGLDVVIHEAVRGIYPVDVVLSGEAEYGVMAEELLTERAAGKPVVVMGVIYQHSPYILMTTKESGLHSVEKLAGKRVMKSISRPTPQLDAMFKNAGVNLDDVHFLPNTWDVASLISGKTDAMDAYITDEPDLLRQKGVEPFILHPRRYGIDFYGDCLFTTEEEIHNHTRRARAFHRATIKGWDYALEHPDEMIEYILTLPGIQKRGITREHLIYEFEESLKLIRPELIKIGESNPARWEKMVETYIELGLIKADFNLNGFIYDPGYEPHWHWLHILLIVTACTLVMTFLAILWNRKLRETAALAVRQMRESDRRYQRLFHEAAQGVLIAEVKTKKLTYANPAFCRMVGYTKNELIKLSVQDIHPPDQLEYVLSEFKAQVEGDKSLAHEIPFLRKNGSIFYADVTASTIVIDGRESNVGFVADATARIEASRALHRSLDLSNRIRRFMVEINDCRTVDDLQAPLLQAAMDICGMDCGGVYIVENGEACLRHIVNLPEDYIHLVGRMPLSNPLLQKAMEAREPMVVNEASEEIRSMILSFGICHAYSVPLFVAGKIFGFLNVGTHKSEPPDSTAIHNLGVLVIETQSVIRRIADEVVHDRMAMAIEQAAESIIVSDKDHRIIYVNPAFEKVTGYSLEEVMGRHPRILDAGQQGADFHEVVEEQVEKGETWTGQFINKTKDGRIIIEDASVSPVFDPTGTIINYVTVKRDITHEIEIEEQLRHAQKMEAVGKLAGGIAHDFNNLLQTILGYAELIMRSPAADAQVRQDMEEVYGAAERAAALTRQLLTFSRRQVVKPQNVNLNELLADLIKIVRRGIRPDIELDVISGADLWPVYADPGQVEQVVINLCFNARDAMPRGGKLMVETENADITREFCRNNTWAREGKYVCLRVKDTGHGIDAETMKRIYEPFFSTKEAGKGTGLGLSTVYGIVQQHNGLIHVESEVGKGTTFSIYFCMARKEPRAAEAPVPVSAAGGKETILLAEDEQSVVAYTRRVLEQVGYTVLTAATGLEAVDLFNRHLARIDLVLMDIVMPGINGTAAREEMIKIRPDIPVLFISGYSHGAIRTEQVAAQKIQIIMKPFRAAVLLAKVREILDSRPA